MSVKSRSAFAFLNIFFDVASSIVFAIIYRENCQILEIKFQQHDLRIFHFRFESWLQKYQKGHLLVNFSIFIILKFEKLKLIKDVILRHSAWVMWKILTNESCITRKLWSGLRLSVSILPHAEFGRNVPREGAPLFTMSHSQDLYFRIFGLYSLVSIGTNIQILKPWNILLRLNKNWTDTLVHGPVHCSFFQSLKTPHCYHTDITLHH